MACQLHKNVVRALLKADGAALTEYIITGLLIGVFSISLVMLFGDNARALFATTDNSLAGVDSTPATRVSDGPLHASLAGLGATSQGGPSQDAAARKARMMAAVDRALNDPNAERHGDWEMPVNVHPEVANHTQPVVADWVLYAVAYGVSALFVAALTWMYSQEPSSEESRRRRIELELELERSGVRPANGGMTPILPLYSEPAQRY